MSLKTIIEDNKTVLGIIGAVLGIVGTATWFVISSYIEIKLVSSEIKNLKEEIVVYNRNISNEIKENVENDETNKKDLLAEIKKLKGTLAYLGSTLNKKLNIEIMSPEEYRKLVSSMDSKELSKKYTFIKSSNPEGHVEYIAVALPGLSGVAGWAGIMVPHDGTSTSAAKDTSDSSVTWSNPLDMWSFPVIDEQKNQNAEIDAIIRDLFSRIARLGDDVRIIEGKVSKLIEENKEDKSGGEIILP